MMRPPMTTDDLDQSDREIRARAMRQFLEAACRADEASVKKSEIATQAWRLRRARKTDKSKADCLIPDRSN